MANSIAESLLTFVGCFNFLTQVVDAQSLIAQIKKGALKKLQQVFF